MIKGVTDATIIFCKGVASRSSQNFLYVAPPQPVSFSVSIGQSNDRTVHSSQIKVFLLTKDLQLPSLGFNELFPSGNALCHRLPMQRDVFYCKVFRKLWSDQASSAAECRLVSGVHDESIRGMVSFEDVIVAWKIPATTANHVIKFTKQDIWRYSAVWHFSNMAKPPWNPLLCSRVWMAGNWAVRGTSELETWIKKCQACSWCGECSDCTAVLVIQKMQSAEEINRIAFTKSHRCLGCLV